MRKKSPIITSCQKKKVLIMKTSKIRTPKLTLA